MLKKWLLTITGILFLGALGLEIYTRLPTDAEISALDLPDDAEYVVLLFHGSNGKDEPLLLKATEKISELLVESDYVVVKHVVWSPWSDNRLRAGKHAQPIGRQIGTELASLGNLKQLRLIAHSAGAYLLTPLCDALRLKAENPAHVEMTYLDGMGIRGGWDYFYGYRHYGECADFSRAIYSLDPVPGTNAPYVKSHSVNVTDDPARTDVPSHLWPIDYFLHNLDAAELVPGARTHEQNPRGTVDHR